MPYLMIKVFKDTLTNDIVSFEQLGSEVQYNYTLDRYTTYLNNLPALSKLLEKTCSDKGLLNRKTITGLHEGCI